MVRAGKVDRDRPLAAERVGRTTSETEIVAARRPSGHIDLSSLPSSFLPSSPPARRSLVASLANLRSRQINVSHHQHVSGLFSFKYRVEQKKWS